MTINKERAKFLNAGMELIKPCLVRFIAEKPYIMQTIARELTHGFRESGEPLTELFMEHMVEVLTHQLHSALTEQTMNAISHTMGHDLAHSAGASVMAALSKSMVHTFGTTVSHVLAKQATVDSVMHIFNHAGGKYPLHTVATAVVPIIAGQLGGHAAAKSAAALAGPIAVACVLGIAGYCIYHFPKALAKKIALKIRSILSGNNFNRNASKSAIESILEDTAMDLAKEFGKAMLMETETVKNMKEAVKVFVKTKNKAGLEHSKLG